MAHYAFLDDNNIVVEVITGKDENETLDGLTPEEWYGNYKGLRCVRTSYNGNIRGVYAGIGYTYDEVNDVFLEPVTEEVIIMPTVEEATNDNQTRLCMGCHCI